MELTNEQVRQIKNKLTSISLENEKIDQNQREILKLKNEIQEILNDENKDS
jgi:hypothetical protein